MKRNLFLILVISGLISLNFINCGGGEGYPKIPLFLKITPDTLFFTAKEGENSLPDTFSILNESDRGPICKIIPDRIWIFISQDSISLPDSGSVKISVWTSAKSLTEGEYTGNIFCFIESETLKIVVKFTVIKKLPKLTIDQDTVIFKINQEEQETTYIRIGNIGEDTLILEEIIDDAYWLFEKPTENVRIAPGEKDSIMIWINPAGVQPGKYYSKIIINSNDPSAKKVTVWVELELSEKLAEFELIPDSLSIVAYIGSSAYDTIAVFNRGDKIINLESIASNQLWLKVTPPGLTVPVGGYGLIYVEVEAKSLQKGIYKATITITPQKGPLTRVPVFVEILGRAEIEVSDDTLNLEALPSARDTALLQIRNKGSDTLFVYRIDKDVNWLTITPLSFNLPPNQSTNIKVIANSTGLNQGTYKTNFKIVSNDIENPEKKVIVEFKVLPPPPSFTISKDTLIFSTTVGKIVTDTLTIRNTGTRAVNIQSIASDQRWVSINPDKLTVPVGGYSDVIITVNPAGLALGQHRANITIISEGLNPIIIPVFLNLLREPTIATIPEILEIDIWPNTIETETLKVLNVGDLILMVDSIIPQDDFITVSPDSFAVGARDTENVQVIINAEEKTGPATITSAIRFYSNAPNSPVLMVVVRINIKGYVFYKSFGSTGTGNGEFSAPTFSSVDDQYLYVVDEGNKRVQHFNLNGGFILKWGTAGTGPGSFGQPTGIDVNPSHIFIADVNPPKVQKFNKDTTFVILWDTLLTANDTMETPMGLDVSSGFVYVSDKTASVIYVFTLTGTYERTIGTPGTSNGQLNGPEGLVVVDSFIYVADTDNDRISIFKTNGDFVSAFGSSGTESGKFDQPSDIAYWNKFLFVCDLGNNRIQIFTKTGDFILSFGSSGTSPGQFSSPRAISIDLNGNVYVSDTGNDRIQVFKIE